MKVPWRGAGSAHKTIVVAVAAWVARDAALLSEINKPSISPLLTVTRCSLDRSLADWLACYYKLTITN